MKQSVEPHDDGCRVHFHPTTVRILQTIEDNLDRGYRMTWAGIAKRAGVSTSTLYLHLKVLEQANYIERGAHFGSTVQMVSINDPIEYDCENGGA